MFHQLSYYASEIVSIMNSKMRNFTLGFLESWCWSVSSLYGIVILISLRLWCICSRSKIKRGN